MPRVELPGGAWADVSDRVPFGIHRRVRAAFERWRGQDPDARWAAEGEVVAAMVTAWSYDAPLTPEGVDALDANVVDTLFPVCTLAYREGTGLDPKGDASSSSTPGAAPSSQATTT